MDKKRVLLLAHKDQGAWTPHYVAAFQAVADTRLLDPPANWPDTLPRDWLTDALEPGFEPDLAVAMQSGLPHIEGIASLPFPTAYVTVDTWHDPIEYAMARNYDFVFAAQREYVPLLRATGSRHVFWLPLACAPEAHYPEKGEVEWDIAFAGSCEWTVHLDRARRLAQLGHAFSVRVASDLSPEDTRALYAHARIGFNSAIAEDVNMRVFEILAMGKLLLTNAEAACNGLFDLFEDGRHLVAYTDTDLLEKARYYLEHPGERECIARAGREEVLSRHTYRHRVTTILDTVASLAPHRWQVRPAHHHAPLLSFLPASPGVVADVGLGLGVSRFALHRLGVTAVVGMSGDPAEIARRARSYDAMAPWPPPEDLRADTVALTAAALTASDFEAQVRVAWHMLPEGGTLLARLNGAVLTEIIGDAPLTCWLPGRDFHLVAHCVQENGAGSEITVLFAARKRTRRLVDILLELCGRHPVPGITLEGIRSSIAPDL